MQFNVLVLQVYTTVDLELIKHELAAINAALKGYWYKWIRVHRLQSFVVVTHETPLELKRRLADVIFEKPGIGGIYCFTAPEDLVGNYGELEALRFHISGGWLEARKRNRTQNMRDPHRRHFTRKRRA